MRACGSPDALEAARAGPSPDALDHRRSSSVMKACSREGERTIRNASPRLEMETKSSPRSSSPRACCSALADDAVHVIDDLEPLQVLQRLHAAEAHIDEAELPVIEQHPLYLDLHVRQGRQAGDVVAVGAGVAEDVARWSATGGRSGRAWSRRPRRRSGWPPSCAPARCSRSGTRRGCPWCSRTGARGTPDARPCPAW